MWEPKYVTLASGESPCQTVDGLADGFMRWLGKERVRLHLVLGDSCGLSEFEPFQAVYQWAREGQWTWDLAETELLVVSLRSFEKLQDWFVGQRFRCPLATLDVRDRPCDDTLKFAQPMAAVQVAFKRELPFTLQDEAIHALPFGLVPEPLPTLKPYAERSIPALFLGGASNMTRQAMVSALQTIPGARASLEERLSRPEYLALLADTKVGVCCYGAGFGSYRYWEIPYYGALLVAQPLPILVPHNFRRRQHALFYQSPLELIETVQWALDHPNEAEAIAQAGTLHLLQHHLTIHRAQWLAQIVGAKIQEYVAHEQVRFPW